ncbi:hypothetical protein [Desulforamulus ruminis]|uniref:Uncharacterized protein n=1 Tax=Desulforamulus ruminis (strain ATCC 23193 / DSM 2154 / NCIMB 8452 / DL) TaxID=696281 RepID=F6DLF5_DESRL|nr:hypothetical protein [Desulforamulus ruminis]AEG60503.1 hypothetical protein Desru_2254 [Desulforamulus ruminis DSM 2154]
MPATRKGIHPLVYFQPVYLPQGDGTEFAAVSGSVHRDARNARSFRKSLCREFALDYTALRRKYREQGGTGLTPLLLAPEYVLIPIKTRPARCGGDPCYGFFNLNMVNFVEKRTDARFRSVLSLKNGLTVPVLSSVKTIKMMMLMGYSLEQALRIPRRENNSVSEMLIRFLRILEKEKERE